MKFTLIYRSRGKALAENYDKEYITTLQEAKEQSIEWIERFNNTLRSHESERSFVKVAKGNIAWDINKTNNPLNHQNIKQKTLS